ncbi:hypothetical protein HY285_02950 [Candidatus Peregrinibacteria bacterium]|nr:hypothetical protein [Candidatus Peregrinibacteria bacterium]MBI3816474.1 hypothetical protein [Candidatus Peregrinibacteria bacterium]
MCYDLDTRHATAKPYAGQIVEHMSALPARTTYREESLSRIDALDATQGKQASDTG